MSHHLTFGAEARGNIIRIDNVLAGITNDLEKAKTQFDNLYHQEKSAKQAFNDGSFKKIPKVKELNSQIYKLMNGKKKCMQSIVS